MSDTARAMRFGARTAFLIVVAFGADGCSSDECTTKVEAQRYDAAAMCLVELEEVGSVNADSCDDSIAWAVDSAGRCFLFSNLCIPQGFTVLQFGDMRCPTTMTSVPQCKRDGSWPPSNPALQSDGRVGRCAPSRVRR